jgi:hypothetical protein
MSKYLSKLEEMEDLSASSIRTTKINTVLRRIKKLHDLPNDSALRFKERVTNLLERWSNILHREQSASIAEDSSENSLLDSADSSQLGTGSELPRQPTSVCEDSPILQGEQTATPSLTPSKRPPRFFGSTLTCNVRI